MSDPVQVRDAVLEEAARVAEAQPIRHADRVTLIAAIRALKGKLPMNENDERLLQLDIDNIVSDMQRLLNAQARLEAKVDVVLECFNILGNALENAGSTVAGGQDGLERRLEEIDEKADRCEN